MKRLFSLPPWQSVGIVGAAIFAIYAFIALAFEGKPNSQSTLANIAGVAAWILLGVAVIVYVHAWRTRPTAPERAVRRFLTDNTVLADRLGQPVKVAIPERIGEGTGADGVQRPVIAQVEGPLGFGEAHLTLARVSGTWEVLQADLLRDGNVVSLSAGE
jgi:hypothetical protein